MRRVKEVAKMYLIKVKTEEFSFLVIADTLRGLLENLEKFFGEGAKASVSPEGYTIQVRLPNNLVARPVVAVLTKQTRTFPTVNLPTLPFSVPVAGVDG
jgi:hypothetical protein